MNTTANSTAIGLGYCDGLQLGEGWGQVANQLYKNHWGSQEHSGWSDDDDTDPDLPLGHTSMFCQPLMLWPAQMLCAAADEMSIGSGSHPICTQSYSC